MAVFYNTDTHARMWSTLTHPGNDTRLPGSTLELEPGEEVELDLPDDFSDPYLVRKSADKASDRKEPAAEPSNPEPLDSPQED